MQVRPDSFLAGERLWLLVAVGILAIVYLIMQRRRTSYAVRFTNLELLDKVAPSRPGWRRHVPAVIFLLGLAALVVAIARPSQDTRVPKEEATIVMAIDTSLSMEATDVPPTRLAGAKSAAVRFVEDLPDQINLGLISFNGVATVRVFPSQNHEASIAAIESLELGPATAIGDAIFAGLDAIDELADESGQAPPARLIVMSDGETTVGRTDEEAVTKAQQNGIAVSTIAFGTSQGTITLPDEGVTVRVPVNEEKLRLIAENTGGEFYTASSTSELSEVYENIGSQISFEVVNDEISTSYNAIGLALFALAAAFSLLWFVRLP